MAFLVAIALSILFCHNVLSQPTSAKTQDRECVDMSPGYIALIADLQNKVESLTRLALLVDCSALQRLEPSSLSGVYEIRPSGSATTVQVYCDMLTDGGGWLVFQRRHGGSENFYRNWTDYQRGFGDLNGEFWLGNDKLHSITRQQSYELRIDMEDSEGKKAYAKYSGFVVADASDKYRLSLEAYSGTAGDSLSYQNDMKFSTYDADNDNSGTREWDCAELYKGAWWYNYCYNSNLNGEYIHGGQCPSQDCIIWQKDMGIYQPLKFTEMKIRPLY